MNDIEQILEIDKIKAEIVKFSRTLIGKNKILNLKPSSDIVFIQQKYNDLKEMIEVLKEFGEMPLRSEIDIYDLILNAKKGVVFDEITLNMIKSEIQSTVDVIKYSMFNEFDYKYLNNYFLNLKADELVYSKINQTITPENTVKDSASKELSQIRNKIYSLNKEIHNSLGRMLNKYKDKLSGDNFVIKNGRFAIPINTNYKAGVDGIIQDVSDSGQTTFIEPREVLELENEMYVWQLKEKEEVTRILTEITRLIVSHEELLINNSNIISELDFIYSKAKYAEEIYGNIPYLNKEYYFKIYNAKHPLIDKDVCVGNDYMLGKGKTLMLISGPNAGGKTIALKTISIISYMVKLGLAIPVGVDSEMCVFDHIYLDIGDSQSIEHNLSTFSGHISNISVILKSISSRDLVVFDELCSGTDPKEGEALAVSIVKYLLDKKVLSLVTSHYELLKKYGFTNDQILNASFLFNEKTIEPTFKVLLGVSGKSYGFLISKKFGLDQEIINYAKITYENSFENEQDKKIAKLDEKERYLLTKDEKLKNRQEALANLREDLNKREKELQERENRLKSQKIDKFDVYLNDKYREIDNIYSEFLKTKDIKKAEEKLDKINVKKKKNENIELNDYVEIKSLGARGKVVKVDGNKITILSSDGFSFKTTKDVCEKIPEPKEKKKSTINIDNFVYASKQVSTTLNLIGYHLDEGIEALDKYLDDCVLKGFKTVKIIHGYGTGQLRKAIHSHLKAKKNVKSFRLGDNLDGGTGATIVELK
jgi:DNA mismatch repair protein MutS2